MLAKRSFTNVYFSYALISNVIRVVYTRVYFLRADPSQWSVTHVRHWLQWAVDNFNLEGIDASQFQYSGLDLLRQGRDRFLLRAPPYVGDILWEHLDILQKGRQYTVSEYIRAQWVQRQNYSGRGAHSHPSQY